MLPRLSCLFVALATTVPAHAGEGLAAQVSEGSHLTLLALGVIGVIVGRRLSTRRRDRD